MTNKLNNYIVKILAIVLFFISFYSVNSIANWKGNENGGMPDFGNSTGVGIFPQVLGAPRNFFGGEERFNFPNVAWRTDVTKGIVVCANSGVVIKDGKKDTEKHYAGDGSYAGAKARAEEIVRQRLIARYPNIISLTVTAKDIDGIESDKGIVEFDVDYENREVVEEVVSSYVQETMAEIDGALSGNEEIVGRADLANKAGKVYEEWDGDPILGPYICVMEDADGLGYHARQSGVWSNNMEAYILTAMENSYGDSESYHTKYSLAEIQSAYWLTVDKDGYIMSEHIIQGGLDLKAQAEEYMEFLKAATVKDKDGNEISPVLNSYNTTIEYTNTQVVVNQDTQVYTIGPLLARFPEYKDVSYVKALYLNLDNEQTLIYDESHDDFSIVFPEGQGTEGTDTNGLTKTYPKNNVKFYINVPASKVNGAKTLTVNMDVEYLKETFIAYNELRSESHIYRYIGHTGVENSSEYSMAWGYFNVDYSVTYKNGQIPYDLDGDGYYDHWEDNILTEEGTEFSGVYVAQPYVKMSDEAIVDVAQPLTAVLDGYRRYTVYKAATDTIDISLELGGKVWVDKRQGKLSEVNGMFDQEDEVMSGVLVTLYSADGTEIASTRTDENGKYLFTGLNAMKQYYVKFTYNGLYYEPTKYMRNETRYDSYAWENSSKGMDIAKERDQFNMRFEEVKSTPKNILGLKAYKRSELESMEVIDKFGNLIGDNEFAKLCMMDAYSCNGTDVMDLYPDTRIFVTDSYLVEPSNQEVAAAAKKIDILYGKTGEDVDVMHHVNLGLTPRQTVELALLKDIYSITLEINGKEHVYKYNDLADKADEDWKLLIRLSDEYYNTEYSREVFREDYDYKASDYSALVDTDGNKLSPEEIQSIKDGELQIYVKYRISMTAIASQINTKITEVVDYYDKEYTVIGSDATGSEAKYVPYIGRLNSDRMIDPESETYKGINPYLTTSATSIYGIDNDSKDLNENYNRVYITGMEDYLIKSSESPTNLNLYITFRVNKERRNGEDYVILDESLDGKTEYEPKQNIAEINGYKTYYNKFADAPNKDTDYGPEYVEGDVAGIIDNASMPGNLIDSNPENFENDSDRAPFLHLILNREYARTTDGKVWEDLRTEVSSNAEIGNGLIDENEEGVNGVRVQLVEIRPSGKQVIWREMKSGDTSVITAIVNKDGLIEDSSIMDNTLDGDSVRGEYRFVGYTPGNYVIRFVYGSDADSVIGTKATNYTTGEKVDNLVYAYLGQGGLNENSYNGNDYKSTTYQVNVDNGTSAYENTEVGTFIYNFAEAEKFEKISDAKDIMSRREVVENYSNTDVTNGKAEILSSFENIPAYDGVSYSKTSMEDLLDELYVNTNMIASTGTMDINVEYDRALTENQLIDNIGDDNRIKSGYFYIRDVDFGLEKRPVAQLKMSKEVENVKLVLANGNVLFDARSTATNVLWNNHTYHLPDVENTYAQGDNYNGYQIKIPAVRLNNSGLIQLTVDEELLQGANIQITYLIQIANTGEVDYKENSFYYTGIVSDPGTIVKTNPGGIVDYVGSQQTAGEATRNNLKFEKAINPDWDVLTVNELIEKGLINEKLRSAAKKHNTIIYTETTARDLVPILVDEDAKTIKDYAGGDRAKYINENIDSVAAVQLVLSQVLSGDTKSDDMTYNNIAELVKVSNTVGRRMSYSVVGNQDPTANPIEIDSDKSEEVVITPPFGEHQLNYYLGFGLAAILIIGVAGVLMFAKKEE